MANIGIVTYNNIRARSDTTIDMNPMMSMMMLMMVMSMIMPMMSGFGGKKKTKKQAKTEQTSASTSSAVPAGGTVININIPAGVNLPAVPTSTALTKKQIATQKIKSRLPYGQHAELLRKYGTWAVGLAESVCSEGDCECVERNAVELLRRCGIIKEYAQATDELSEYGKIYFDSIDTVEYSMSGTQADLDRAFMQAIRRVNKW